jgi:ethanolamine utilization protein EutN
MQLGRVMGTVVATVKADGLEGVRLLIVQPLDRDQRPRGTALVAADAVATAGPGDLVHYVAAREAAQALRETFVPVDHAIVGIVDTVDTVDTPDGTDDEPAQVTAADGGRP